MRIFTVICLFILLLFITQYIITGLYGFITPFHVFPSSKQKNKFAILIPARNEEQVIGNLLESLEKMHYRKEMYEVFVLVNGCTDKTEQIVFSHHSSVIKMDKASSKGEVLKNAFTVLKDRKDIDAFVIFDSDNLVNADFLKFMNDALNNGYDIIQGRREGKNIHDNIISSIYELFYMMQNVFYNHTRMCVKSSAIINGTGWAITRKWINEHGFDVRTITEDLELSAIAALLDTPVGYCHDAVTYDEFPNSLPRQFHQLQRWIYGQVECMRLFEWKLLKKALHSATARDQMLLFLTPVLVLALLVAVCIGVAICPESLLILWLKKHIWSLLLTVYIMIVIVACMEVFKMKARFPSMLPGILCYPFFFLLWIPFAIVSLFRRHCTWSQIQHDRSIRIEDLK